MMSEATELSPEQFIEELEAAPSWNTWQQFDSGIIGLYIYYGFGRYVYFVNLERLDIKEAGKFYNTLTQTINVPSIRKAKAV